MYKRSIAFIICTICAVILINYILEHPFRPINTDTTVNSVRSFDAFPEDSFDVVVYGSSHAWCGIDMGMLDEKYGIPGYNYGCAWQHVNTTKLFLQDSLRYHTPKVVILETDMLTSPLADTDMCGEIYYSKGVGAGKEKWDYLRQCFGNKPSRYIGYFLPTVVFHDNWKELTAESFMENSNDHDFVKSRGYLGSSSIEPVTVGNYRDFSQEPMPEDTLQILDQMVEICRQRGITVILCTMPFGDSYEYPYGEAVKAYAEQNNLCYINYCEKVDELNIDCDNDFRNAEHLNDYGAEKVTNDMGQYLRDKLGLGAKQTKYEQQKN